MIRLMLFLFFLFLPLKVSAQPVKVAIACDFEKLPLILILVKGGMGADDNTIKIGNNAPVPISIGSGLMSAEFQGQSYTFSLRLPANVSIDSPSTGSVTYHGHCIRSLGS